MTTFYNGRGVYSSDIADIMRRINALEANPDVQIVQKFFSSPCISVTVDRNGDTFFLISGSRHDIIKYSQNLRNLYSTESLTDSELGDFVTFPPIGITCDAHYNRDATYIISHQIRLDATSSSNDFLITVHRFKASDLTYLGSDEFGWTMPTPSNPSLTGLGPFFTDPNAPASYNPADNKFWVWCAAADFDTLPFGTSTNRQYTYFWISVVPSSSSSTYTVTKYQQSLNNTTFYQNFGQGTAVFGKNGNRFFQHEGFSSYPNNHIGEYSGKSHTSLVRRYSNSSYDVRLIGHGFNNYEIYFEQVDSLSGTVEEYKGVSNGGGLTAIGTSDGLYTVKSSGLTPGGSVFNPKNEVFFSVRISDDLYYWNPNGVSNFFGVIMSGNSKVYNFFGTDKGILVPTDSALQSSEFNEDILLALRGSIEWIALLYNYTWNTGTPATDLYTLAVDLTDYGFASGTTDDNWQTADVTNLQPKETEIGEIEDCVKYIEDH